MTEKELHAALRCVTRLMHFYRAKATAQNQPFDKKRVKEILALPDADLITMLIRKANLTVQEEQAINYCYRLGYTQEETADKLCVSRNSVYAWSQSGLTKLHKAWSGVFWVKNL